jgi:hypothetical protein
LPVSEPVAALGVPEVQTYDYTSGRWDKVKVLSYDRMRRLVIAEVQHFSTYVATPPTTALAPELSRGPEGSRCAESPILRAPLKLAFSGIPAKLVNGHGGGSESVADLLSKLPDGKALQVFVRASARTRDGAGSDEGWLLLTALRRADGKLDVKAYSDAASGPLLKTPEALDPTSPEAEAFLNGTRAHFVFHKITDTTAGIATDAEVSLYLVDAQDAARPPVKAVNPIATADLEGVAMAHDTPAHPGYDPDCDQAPSSYDPTPQGEPAPVLVPAPASPVRVTVGGQARLSVRTETADVAFSWLAGDPSLALQADGAAATIKPTAPGVFRVLAVGKKGAVEARVGWEILVDAAESMDRNTPPTVSISASDRIVRAGERVGLLAVGRDAEQADLTFRWRSQKAGVLSGGEGPVVTFSSPTPGDYTVECVASDGLATSAPASLTITVLSATANRPPAAPTVTPLLAVVTHEPDEPASVTLTAQAVDPDGDEVTFKFEPGPGAPPGVTLSAAGASATLTTSVDGVFTVFVTAIDAKGAVSPFTAARVSVLPKAADLAPDADGDGYPEGADCNDADPKVYPGAREICADGIDQDCDGRDRGAAECDEDGDRYSTAQGDCDDRDPRRHPGAAERCDGVDNDCDGMIDEGFPLGRECTVGLGACQATGQTVCSATFAAVVCGGTAGAPSMEVCDGVDNDCNGIVDDVPQATAVASRTVASCGGCGMSCAERANSAPLCLVGGCGFRCLPGFADLDRRPDNGCECGMTNGGVEICDGLDNDCNGVVDDGVTETVYPGPERTQGVGVCAAGVRTCRAGQLVVTVEPRIPSMEICDGLDNDCNGRVDETFDLLSDPRNCGGCGVVCSSGVCVRGRCGAGTTDAGAPTDGPRDPGTGADAGLPPSGTCVSPRSSCRDPAGREYCADLTQDAANCGACGRTCPAGAICSRGTCVAGTEPIPGDMCPLPSTTCRDATSGRAYCADLSRDAANCGGCGRPCASGNVCQDSRCVASTTPGGCTAPQVSCRDTTSLRELCTDLSRDPAHCGTCNNRCPVDNVCERGVCVGGTKPICESPLQLCKDATGTREYCADVTNDSSNCGACGRVCEAGLVCVRGECGKAPEPVCEPPFMSCTDPTGLRSVCTDVTRDNANCGACGKVCQQGTQCERGQCAPVSSPTCVSPSQLCKDAAGREACVDLSRDPANCGNCGVACASGVCEAGRCTLVMSSCLRGETVCKDATGKEYCANLSLDPANCGQCGLACAKGDACEAGRCASALRL